MFAEVQKHLFEPFYTTKDQGKGTGLGLSMVYGTIKQSGGEIEVESRPGKGSIFKIYFPLVAAGTPETCAGKAQADTKERTETVLLVEDEESLRRLAERVLRANGYKVISAADGKAALAAAERHGKPVDLLLTDLIMPGMNGRELALVLARRKLARRTLYMSGYTDEAIVKHGVLEPGLAFIYKSFTVEALSAKLREVLDGPADKAKA
jgi:CheY-like chemotaxis protein